MSDWAPAPLELAEHVRALTPERREEVARRWARAAQYEHASIASFARLSMQLMAIGAPPELLDAAHCAARDEIRHAKLSFAVASAYAGRGLGPGPLPIVADALGPVDFVSVVRANVVDGCVGETVAAFEAEAQRDGVGHPALARCLDVIAEDEAKHAELAYQIVGWALAERPSEARDAVREGFAAGLARYRLTGEPAGVEASEPWLAQHGLLDGTTRRLARARALREAIEPAARELSGGAAASAE